DSYRLFRRLSSVGEDRAILLGFAMMAFSVLMFFVVGITVLKPYVASKWEEASCVLLGTEILEEWVDCRGVSAVPCLRVKVNLTASNQTALLHFDEDLVLLCFYIPKCRMARAELQREVEEVKKFLEAKLESPKLCFADRKRHPERALWGRKYTHKDALLAVVWPCLMLGGGALLVGLVKLTQYLARMSSETCSEAGGSRMTGRHTQGKLYRLLQRSSTQSPS
uniref:Potassium calcium-activated channel subfamily M regulatory beta subunit 3 n=1 Tax=Sparus aurata TaxID=8175 RepID=A0A671ULH7_SPAAU